MENVSVSDMKSQTKLSLLVEQAQWSTLVTAVAGSWGFALKLSGL